MAHTSSAPYPIPTCSLGSASASASSTSGPHPYDLAEVWSAAWPSLNIPWVAVDNAATVIPHETYLTGRRFAGSVNALTVDSYHGKRPIASDSLPESWQNFYPTLSAADVERFARATNNDVLVSHVPLSYTALVLFRLYVLQTAPSPAGFQWMPVLQSLVPQGLIRTGLKLAMSKVKKRKGTPTQSQAVLMLEATDMLDTYQWLAVNHSSMFGIMRRSYVAKQRLRESGAIDRQAEPPLDQTLPGDPNIVDAGYSYTTISTEQTLITSHNTGRSHDPGNVTISPVQEQILDGPASHHHILSHPESSMGFYAVRIATYLGVSHREIGFNEAAAEIEAPLKYYEMARERMVLASRFTDGWTELVRLLANRASARLETTIRRLLETPARRLHAIYNFYGGDEGTIVVDRNGDVVVLNADPVTGRSLETHDNVAILARWVHMQGLLSRERPGYDSQAIYDEVYANTLFPYFYALTGQPPTVQDISRFWTFLDLEYTEYWFYFLQSTEEVALYRMTLALQRLQSILLRTSPQAGPLPSMNTSIRPDRAFWFKDLPP